MITIVGGATFLFYVFQTPEYSSAARIIIIQKSLQDSDAFIAARSSERLSIILSEVIYSNSFFNDVLASSKEIVDDFGSDPAKRREKWQHQVKNRIDSDKGIIEIAVFDENRKQSTEILNSVLRILIENGERYHGGSNIEIRVIDEPLVSNEPVRPNTVFNTVAAVVLAFIGSSVFVYLFNDGSELAYKNNKSKFSIPPIGNFRDDTVEG